MEILKQGQYQPVKVEHQVMIIYAAINGLLDDIKVEKIRDFEFKLYEFIDTNYPEIGRKIKTTGDLDEETEHSLKNAIEELKEEYDTDLA